MNSDGSRLCPANKKIVIGETTVTPLILFSFLSSKTYLEKRNNHGTFKLDFKELFGHHKIVPFKVKSSLFQTFNQSTVEGIPNEESRENGYFLGINTFINKKYQLNGPFFVINHGYGFKRFSYNGWITNLLYTF